jgi:sarcosine oxidase subunit alpha
MRQPRRLASAGEAIDRARPLGFSFEGRRLEGFAGDTLASALLAAGVDVVARSFKYRRPRGVWGCGAEEPNAILDVRDGARHDPNAQATRVTLRDGLVAAGLHGGTATLGARLGLPDRLHALLPAGFYYKTFMRPDWHLFEPAIRAMAGLGQADRSADPDRHEQRWLHLDVAVIGAGPAGLAAARVAADSGLRVGLIDDGTEVGGQLLVDDEPIDDLPGSHWARRIVAELESRPGVVVLRRTTAFGFFDHGLLGLLEVREEAPRGWARERLWKVRARRVVIATGAIERPIVFPDNDCPGIMSAYAVRHYLRRHGVLAGSRAVVLTGDDSGYATAGALRRAGAAVTVADLRAAGPAFDGLVFHGAIVAAVEGRRRVAGVRLVDAASPTRRLAELEADLVAVAGGWTPTVHLFCQAGGKLRYDDTLQAFVPDANGQGEIAAGAVCGARNTAEALAQGHAAGVRAIGDLGRASRLPAPRGAAVANDLGAPRPCWHVRLAGTRQWIDLHNDVTVADVELAARENYVSVEHLKRYTTLGMGTDQGKTSNLNGLALLAEITGRPIPEVGTTTFRPPYTPVSLGALAGTRKGPLLSPLRRLPAERVHGTHGAEFDEYGGWWRPACYRRDGEDRARAIEREVRTVREGVGLFDASPLGKIAVSGPDAALFCDRFYYNALLDLVPGRVRYCLLLNESGKIYDDGVVARLDEERFLLSPSSSHATGVHQIAEEWRQTGWPELDVAIANLTSAWATLAVTGPRARAVMERLDTDIPLDPTSLPHMAIGEGRVCGVTARIARVSFTGELSFEISVPSGYAAGLFDELMRIGGPDGLVPFGSEALLVLRMEKGYVLIGRDTDGTTEPDDLGMGGALARKPRDFIGRRSLQRDVSRDPGRLQLVGLANSVADEVLPTGAHVIERDGGRRRSLGYVTSSAWSPTLRRGIALGLLADGRAKIAAGERVELFHLGRSYVASVVSPVWYDPRGERLRG